MPLLRRNSRRFRTRHRVTDRTRPDTQRIHPRLGAPRDATKRAGTQR